MLLLALAALQGLSATDVLMPQENEPLNVVLVRKLTMRTFAASMGDLQPKLGAGAVSAAPANAFSIAALATYLPTVFDETYSEVYPVQGSRFFYRGAPLDTVRSLAQQLNTAAEELAAQAQAGNRSGVDAALQQVNGTCGACHNAARGQVQ